MTRFLVCTLLITFSLSLYAQQLPDKDEKAIRKVFQEQQDSWNKGDIDGFMEGYWKDEGLMFVGSNGVNYGWDATLARYKKAYPDKANMGELSFTLLRIEKLGRKSAFVLGKWYLKREMGDIGGYFTLVWKKIKGKWVIVSDHTS